MSSSMIGPSWLALIFGIVMLAAAVFAAGRIAVAWRTQRITDYEVDGHHVLMGVSMAGMLIPSLGIVTDGPSTTIWLLVWVVVTLWFAASVVRGAMRNRSGARFSGHHLPHLVMSAAMLYMFAVAAAPVRASGDISGMSGMASSALVPWPTLDALFLVFMAVYAVLVIDRFPLLASVQHSHVEARENGAVAVPTFLAPRTAGVENVVMGVVMGYMLTMLLV